MNNNNKRLLKVSYKDIEKLCWKRNNLLRQNRWRLIKKLKNRPSNVANEQNSVGNSIQRTNRWEVKLVHQ